MLLENWEIKHWDCLELMKDIPSGSIDMILADLPFWQTRNDWDCIIDPEKLWDGFERIIKPNGAIILFSNGMFTAQLMMYRPKLWRYNLIWSKVLISGFLNSKKMPLRSHEDICVFYKKPPTYNPQMTQGATCHSIGKAIIGNIQKQNNYGEVNRVKTEGNMKYPKSILEFQKPHPSIALHSTQKPTELVEWLIRTYTNEGEIVLDVSAGSWTTGIWAQNTGRKFLLFEKKLPIFKGAEKRLVENEKIKQ